MTMAVKVGRLPSPDSLRARINVSLHEKDYEIIQKLARKRKISAGTWVREVTVRAARRAWADG